jgi:hypothetical protein
MAHRDLQKWSPAAVILLPAALGWVLPLVSTSVHVSGLWWLLLLVVSLLLVVAIIFVARPVPSLSASSEQLETKIGSLEGIAETYRAELGPDAPETIRVRRDLDAARERLAAIQYRQAKEARLAVANAAGSDAVIDRSTMILLGIIGITLPLVLIVGDALALRSLSFQSSLSAYYFSDMRDTLVGGLCGMGVLFIRARGGSLEVPFTTIAGMLAIVAALAPPTVLLPPRHTSERNILIGTIHATSISALVMLTAALCLIVFPRTGRGDERTRLRLTHDQIYRLSGIIILCDVVAATLSNILPSSLEDGSTHLFLWSEAMWLVTFGFACIVRGGVVSRRSPPLEFSRQHSVPGNHGGGVTGPGPAESEAGPTSAPQLPASIAQPWQSSPPSLGLDAG